tara:strand:- start:192 stop:431 length:240 start_codon:yes stop_codon:yes gene_type:complete
MANRFPLVVDSSNLNIKELPSGDNLDLTGSAIVNGAWQGNSISTSYTDAKVTSVNGSTGAITGLASTGKAIAMSLVFGG